MRKADAKEKRHIGVLRARKAADDLGAVKGDERRRRRRRSSGRRAHWKSGMWLRLRCASGSTGRGFRGRSVVMSALENARKTTKVTAWAMGRFLRGAACMLERGAWPAQVLQKCCGMQLCATSSGLSRRNPRRIGTPPHSTVRGSSAAACGAQRKCSVVRKSPSRRGTWRRRGLVCRSSRLHLLVPRAGPLSTQASDDMHWYVAAPPGGPLSTPASDDMHRHVWSCSQVGMRSSRHRCRVNFDIHTETGSSPHRSCTRDQWGRDR